MAPPLLEKNFHPNPVPPNYQEESCLELMFSPTRFMANAKDLHEVRPFLDESYLKYKDIKHPVTLIFGRQDQILYVFTHAFGFKHQVPHTRIHMLEETGHLPHHAHKELVVKEIESFWSK